MAEAERGEQSSGALVCFLAGAVLDELGQHDIFGRVEVRQQMVELIDEAELIAAHAGAPVRIELRRLLSGDPDRAAEPALKQPDRLKQGRLARSRRAEQGHDLARADGEVDAAQDFDRHSALGEAARQAGDR
jgi:hypothetical protein